MMPLLEQEYKKCTLTAVSGSVSRRSKSTDAALPSVMFRLVFRSLPPPRFTPRPVFFFSFFLLLGISSGHRSCSAAPLSRPCHSFTAPHEPRRPACAPFVSRSAHYCPGSRPQRSSRRQKVPPTSCKSFTSLALLSALIGQSPVGLKGRRRAAVQLTSSREKDWLAGLLSFTTTA